MFISYMSLNRIMEERAATDDDYRAALEKNYRPRLSHRRRMSDDELLAKLQGLGLDADRTRLLDAFPRYISAQRMAKALIAQAPVPIPQLQTDWVWIALTCLWERWQPELSNTEMADDKMQAGYAALQAGDAVQACRVWLETWRAILDIMKRGGIESLDVFDDCFGGTQSVFNWIQDLEMELHNAGLQDPRFFHERIALCETMMDRFSNGQVPIDQFKQALAESHFELGDRETGDRLFRRWLDENPREGGSWIGWSDCYWTFAAQRNKNAARAEQILKEGLATPGVENRTHILERLASLYEETGRAKEAEGVHQKIKRLPDPKETPSVKTTAEPPVAPAIRFGDKRLPTGQLPSFTKSLPSASSLPDDQLSRQSKVGRNEPCACGSGKKFKKCCGGRGPTS